jgi:hypothetical protein
VIVRISTEGQYELSDEAYDELNRLDNDTVEAVRSGDEATFAKSYAQLLELVRSKGTPLEGDDLHESALILPPPDLTLDEAEHEFTGEGLLPD